jgi:hypothetical protein
MWAVRDVASSCWKWPLRDWVKLINEFFQNVPHSCDRFSKENIFESVMAIVEIIADFLRTKSTYFVS